MVLYPMSGISSPGETVLLAWSRRRLTPGCGTMCPSGIIMAMARTGEIAEFNPSDGLTPWQVRKLNNNFLALSRRLPSTGSVVEVDSVETLSPGQPAYVEDVGLPPVAKLRFGIPRGEKGDKGDRGDTGPKGDPGDPADIVHIGSSAPNPRGSKILWYDSSNGKLRVWQLSGSTWSWKEVSISNTT